MENTKLLYKSREAVIKLFNDYSWIAFEAERKSIRGEGLKIITAKQILQRLAKALAQVKAGNASQNLLNELGEIIYSVYQTKEITKGMLINITNSIKI